MAGRESDARELLEKWGNPPAARDCKEGGNWSQPV